MKTLKRIFGSRKVEKSWERRINAELIFLYGESMVTSFVKTQRLWWLGHIQRMDYNTTTKTMWKATVGKEGRGGWPRLRWMEAVKMDLKEKGIGTRLGKQEQGQKTIKETHYALGLNGLYYYIAFRNFETRYRKSISWPLAKTGIFEKPICIPIPIYLPTQISKLHVPPITTQNLYTSICHTM